MPLDRQDPEVLALIKEVTEEVTGSFKGLKDKNDELISERRKLSEKLKQFDGIDVEAFKNLQNRMQNDEEMKLIQEGKVDEVLNRRFEKIRLESEAKIKLAEESLTTASQERDFYKHRFESENINTALRQAAIAAGVTPEAIDDVVMRGSATFALEEGALIARSKSDNKIITDSKGKPLTVDSFVDSLRDKAPHYWRTSGKGSFSDTSHTLEGLEAKLSDAASRNDMKSYNQIKEEIAKRRSA